MYIHVETSSAFMMSTYRPNSNLLKKKIVYSFFPVELHIAPKISCNYI